MKFEKNRELAVCISNENQSVNGIETIDAIKKAGFKNVFIQWYNRDFIPSQEEQLKYVRKQGLNIIFAHLGYDRMNDLWVEDIAKDDIVDEYIRDIKICKENNIPLVIIHCTNGTNPPKYNKTGLSRIKRIVEYAKTQNIKVAFENNKVKGYLDYIIDNLDDDNLGICYDSGHCHAFFNDELDFEKFKNRIFAVHLHDNEDATDQHLLPFDGTINWDKLVTNLKDSAYLGPVTLELCYRNKYLNMSVEDFYKKGYEVGLKLQKMFED